MNDDKGYRDLKILMWLNLITFVLVILYMYKAGY